MKAGDKGGGQEVRCREMKVGGEMKRKKGQIEGVPVNQWMRRWVFERYAHGCQVKFPVIRVGYSFGHHRLQVL